MYYIDAQDHGKEKLKYAELNIHITEVTLNVFDCETLIRPSVHLIE